MQPAVELAGKPRTEEPIVLLRLPTATYEAVLVAISYLLMVPPGNGLSAIEFDKYMSKRNEIRSRKKFLLLHYVPNDA